MSIFLQNAEKQSTIHEAGDKLGTYYLTDNPTHYEIQRTNNFVFYINGLKDSLQIPQNSYAAANAEDVIRVSVSKASVPHFKQSAIAVKRGNNTMKFAGVPEFDAGELTLNDYIGAGTKDVLMAWQSKAYDVRTEKVGLASDYKRDAYLLEYTPDYQLVRTWKLMGCWISGISEDPYSHDSAEKHTINATIEYDKAWIDISDID
jgi:hypothetical protein